MSNKAVYNQTTNNRPTRVDGIYSSRITLAKTADNKEEGKRPVYAVLKLFLVTLLITSIGFSLSNISYTFAYYTDIEKALAFFGARSLDFKIISNEWSRNYCEPGDPVSKKMWISNMEDQDIEYDIVGHRNGGDVNFCSALLLNAERNGEQEFFGTIGDFSGTYALPAQTDDKWNFTISIPGYLAGTHIKNAKCKFDFIVSAGQGMLPFGQGFYDMEVDHNVIKGRLKGDGNDDDDNPPDDSGDDDHGKERITICHATGSKHNPWVRITLPEQAQNGHFKNNGTPKSGHEDDVIVEKGESCPEIEHEDPDNDHGPIDPWPPRDDEDDDKDPITPWPPVPPKAPKANEHSTSTESEWRNDEGSSASTTVSINITTTTHSDIDINAAATAHTGDNTSLGDVETGDATSEVIIEVETNTSTTTISVGEEE